MLNMHLFIAYGMRLFIHIYKYNYIPTYWKKADDFQKSGSIFLNLGKSKVKSPRNHRILRELSLLILGPREILYTFWLLDCLNQAYMLALHYYKTMFDLVSNKVKGCAKI